MSGVGPVEPGEGSHALDAFPAARTRRTCPAGHFERHRRAALGGLLAVAVLAGGGYLYATRPRPEPPPDPPYPSQVTAIDYLNAQATGASTASRSFTFTVEMTTESGPPVTVTRISQPYAGMSVTSSPPTPFRTRVGSPRKITITMRVTECGKVPRNAGLPFLDVTLRNPRAIEVHSFILGTPYARDLSRALEVACSNEKR
ncbi:MULTISPECIES: Tat pathway signal sequence domain protein [Streptomyces]|uniref:Tat pathway signal sequence domain protein n=1 Tax=Streptomyces fungicidicus TaxID=68203 RepID=A0A494UYD2_9ACTN|nr:Tat pathway signal sequence domain protein [Streptomyces fungicidicus]AYL35534.1 Tat pathway signal sequence domain protein [Streptomyces fungicidicus]